MIGLKLLFDGVGGEGLLLLPLEALLLLLFAMPLLAAAEVVADDPLPFIDDEEDDGITRKELIIYKLVGDL
jgi:hypothetical protein